MMMEKIVILGTAHRLREPGKMSPDGKLREAVWSREIILDLKAKLQEYGVTTYIDYPDFDLPKTMQTPSVRLERQRELALRVNEVNSICDRYGVKNVLYVSIHLNAAGSDGKWHDASGWQVCVSPEGSFFSRLLADKLFDTARKHGLKVRQPFATRKYWEQSLYVLNRTHCPAVLTENLFMDNKNDAGFLLSEEGRHEMERIHLEGILAYINELNTMELIDNV
jgi:N-acetylmuramoyl-L-alanine amidase